MLYITAQCMQMCQRPRASLLAARSCASQVSWVSNDRTAFIAKTVPVSTMLPLIGSKLDRSRSVYCRAAAPQSTKLDSSMIWGDIMMLTATELASERLPKQVTGVLSLTLLAAWIGVRRWRYCCGTTQSSANSAVLAGGNCKGGLHCQAAAPIQLPICIWHSAWDAAGSYNMGMLAKSKVAFFLWSNSNLRLTVHLQLLFVPTAMAMYACLVSHHLLDGSVFRVPPGARVSPEGEVMIAALFTLMSWRGIYSSQMF